MPEDQRPNDQSKMFTGRQDNLRPENLASTSITTRIMEAATPRIFRSLLKSKASLKVFPDHCDLVMLRSWFMNLHSLNKVTLAMWPNLPIASTAHGEKP